MVAVHLFAAVSASVAVLVVAGDAFL